MTTIRGAFRFILGNLIILLLAASILLLGWIPWKHNGLRLVERLPRLASTLILRLFAIDVDLREAQHLLSHRGFVFPNHGSYLDVLLLASLLPVRFLAKAEIRQWALVGYIAAAIGTVFVERESKDSREQARRALARIDFSPPVVIFPEGKIGAPGGLQPFRYGAFAIAVEGGIPFLPCVIAYTEPWIVFWGDETLVAAVWRLARRPGRITATVMPLHTIHPTADENPQLLALETRGAMEAARATLENGGADAVVPGL